MYSSGEKWGGGGGGEYFLDWTLPGGPAQEGSLFRVSKYMYERVGISQVGGY